MSDANRDQNHVPVALGQSSTSATTTLPFLVSSSTGRLLVDSGGGAVPTEITVANEATDTSCFIAFFTAATGDLGPKTNANMTFNSSTGVATFASTVLSTTDINGGTIDGVTIGGASAGAITGTTITATTLRASSNDSGSIGAAGTAFSDLFLATGALIDFGNGNSVITHSSGILTVSTGDLRITTAGTNAASVVTVGGAQTLTNKTLTSPVINTPTGIVKGDVGLGNVDNTSDVNKPVSTATQTALDLKANLASPTFTGTVVLPTVTAGGVITLAENAAIALDPAGSADGKYTGITVTGVAGYAQSYGDLVYLAAADSRWELADADAATTGDRMLAMVVVAGGSDGAACTLLLQGIIRADAKFPALTIGSAVYVGETAGAIQVAIPTGADNVIRRVGFALTADEIYFNPSMDSQTTVA